MQLVRIATRTSQLALVQVEIVVTALKLHYPKLEIEIVPISTKGDEILDKSLSKVGGKGLFIKELEQALLSNQADFAVHSMKDMETTLHNLFIIASVLERHSFADALVSNNYSSINDLPKGAIIGTSSQRRALQLLQHKPTLQIKLLRGNLQTRLRKLEQGDFDGIILAVAGLSRMGLADKIKEELPINHFLPAIAQGAIALETLSTRKDVQDLLAVLEHRQTRLCVTAERAFGKALGSNCSLPIAALGTYNADEMQFMGWISDAQGVNAISVNENTQVFDLVQAEQLGMRMAEKIKSHGGEEILQSLK